MDWHLSGMAPRRMTTPRLCGSGCLTVLDVPRELQVGNIIWLIPAYFRGDLIWKLVIPTPSPWTDTCLWNNYLPATTLEGEKYSDNTRLHSSRMRTTRLLPVSPSMHCAGRVCSWGCLLPGGVLSGGVCSRGCIPACNGADPPVNRMIDRCKNITLSQTSFAGGNNKRNKKWVSANMTGGFLWRSQT